ncbi:MAG: TetR-like C-terminal domain-containing protein [Pseudomonadota bacterium]
MAARNSYHHGDLANALLDAADDLLEEEGLGGFTLRACARRAGVSHAAPKHHFGDVQGLLTAVALRGYDRLVATLRAQLAQAHGDLEDEMFATAKAYVQFAQDNPEHFRIMFRADLVAIDMSCPPPTVQATFAELTNVILRQRGEAVLEPAVAMGQAKSAALIDDILLGWCHVHGYAHLRLEGQLDMVPRDAENDHLRATCARLSGLIQAYAQAR